MAGYLEKMRDLFVKKGKSPLKTPQPPAHTVSVESFGQAHNDFSITLYNRLRQPSANLFFSPFSIRAALAMTYAGARGETAAQMSTALGFSASDEKLHNDFREISDRLNREGGGDQRTAVANSLWFQEGSPLLNEYLDLVARHYRGGMNFIDFGGDTEAARATINAWVEEQTSGKIKGLIPPKGLASDSGMVVVNAIYFLGKWVLPFRKSITYDEPFYLESGEEVQAPLMHQTETVRYADTGKFQAIELDYKDSDLAMLVLLPLKKEGLEPLEKMLSAGLLQQCLEQMTAQEVMIYLPRFKITWGTVDIGGPLRSLGMPKAFNLKEADFSGINGRYPLERYALYISNVFHQALVEVDEQGTEAVAATAGAVTFGAMYDPSSPRLPVFLADHPFLFAIRDRMSGVILFLGRVADPTSKS